MDRKTDPTSSTNADTAFNESAAMCSRIRDRSIDIWKCDQPMAPQVRRLVPLTLVAECVVVCMTTIDKSSISAIRANPAA